MSGDCWADGGTADVACFTGFGTVVICGSGTLRIDGAGIGVGGDNLPYLPGLILDDVSFSSGAIFLNERSYSGAPALFVRSGSLETDTLVLSGDLCIAGGSGTVQIVPFTEIQEEIRRNCPEEFFTLIMRRFMMRISQRVADQVKAKALVTGENLGQVASQTMEALRVTEDVVDLPVLRPLIGMDKEEIVRLSRKIGTFDTSILPYEDCCTVFTPRHPRTKPNLDEVREAEAVLDIEGLIDRAMTNREFVRIKL